MDYKIPNSFFEFKLGWYRGINFENEAAMLLNVLNRAKKESDVQQYIKKMKNGLFQHHFLRITILAIMKHILYRNKHLEQSIVLITCYWDVIQLGII